MYLTHILSLHFEFAHNIPVYCDIAVYTIVNLYIVIPYLLVLYLYSFIICVFVLSLSFCCTVEANSSFV